MTEQEKEIATIKERTIKLKLRANHRPPKERIIEEPLEKQFYTIYEVADLLGFHHKTIRRMIKSGELPAKQIGRQWRIKKEDLDQFTSI